MSVTEVVLASVVRFTHSPGFGLGLGFWVGDSENAGVLRLKRVCKCSRQLMHHREKKKVFSSGSYYIKFIIHHTYNVFFIPNAKGLYGKHVLRLMSQISHGENGA